MTLRRATERLREVGSLPVLLSALLIAASGDLSAQDRSRANDSSDRGGSRVAQPRDSAPSRPSASSPPRSSSPSSPPSATPSGGSGSSASPSSPSRGGRYAVPGSPGESRRQPPSRDRRDPNWRSGHGDWYGHGGYYYPRWYRYYGPGWWWAPYGSWGWWWLGDNYWPYDPYYYNYPYDRYDRGRGYYGRDEVGALDLDLSPGRTQVYLDGQYLGTVDQYDGFPSYLWLEKGTYDIAFYLDGYKTLARQVTIYPGTVIDMEDRLEPGESVRPEDLVTKSHERRDERLRYERERRERIGREDRGDREDDADWRDRVRRGGREDRRDRGEEIEIEDDDAGSRGEQGRVRLEVEPDDASIYLDGKFVGTAHDLANLRRGLLVEPGRHNVAVVRPGRESVEREFEVDPGEDLELEIELESADR
jgi:hypothetical protein